MYPNFIQTLKNRATTYNQTVETIQTLEQEGKIFVIRPETPLEIGRMSHNPEEIHRAYQRGMDDAKKQLSVMKSWLAADSNI